MIRLSVARRWRIYNNNNKIITKIITRANNIIVNVSFTLLPSTSERDGNFILKHLVKIWIFRHSEIWVSAVRVYDVHNIVYRIISIIIILTSKLLYNGSHYNNNNRFYIPSMFSRQRADIIKTLGIPRTSEFSTKKSATAAVLVALYTCRIITCNNNIIIYPDPSDYKSDGGGLVSR